MNKKLLFQTTIVLIVLFVVILLVLKSKDIEYYEYYNRPIKEPDTLKPIKLN